MLLICPAHAALAIEPLSPLAVTTPQNAPPTPKLEDLTLQSNITQYGITWTFDRPARVGQFINGDWYVVGPVTVAGINPRPQYGQEVPESEVDRQGGDSRTPVAQRVRNGSQLDLPDSSYLQDCAWDSGQRGYFNYKLAAHLPIAMKPGDCLASSISVKQGEEVQAWGAASHKRPWGDDCPARVAALLTCVDRPLPADAFRPGYGDRSQTIYLARNLHRELLPKLPPFKATWPPDVGDPLKLAAIMQKPWINVGYFGFDEPMENMAHYGQGICQALGEASLYLSTNIDPERKERLLVNFVQIGIDYWSLIKSGHPGWYCWGGHGSGRKFPIILAGTLLGDDKMANVSREFPKAHFGEDEQTAYGHCWTGATVVFCGHSGIDEVTGIGRDFVREGALWGPYEHLDPSKWTFENWRSEVYRRANTSRCWVAEALVMRLMHLEKQWNHDAFFDYVDRWMNEDDTPLLAVLGKYGPDNMGGKDYRTHNHWYWRDTGDMWIQPLWDKYRPLSSAPQDGWKQPHDDSYYRNAVAQEEKSR